MDQYEIIKALGRGAFGTAKLAKRRSDCVSVVLKCIEMVVGEQTYGESDAKEVRALAKCKHPLVVQYFESFEHEDCLVIVMEFVPGGTLKAFLRKQQENLPEECIVRIFAQLVSALAHIHSHRLLHRDFTSRNVLISPDASVVKIADFGLSKMLSSHRSRTNSIVGTPEYMSPELCRGEPYGVQSDVWSLGCLLYELLTLRTPFHASNVPALVLAILGGCIQEPPTMYSSELRCLVRSMLHDDPVQRATLPSVAASPSIALEIIKMSVTLGASQ